MEYLIGIDDTDNLESRGTGHCARQLGLSLQEAGLAKLICITRHQLFVHKEIPFTSHNSSACLLLDCTADNEDAMIEFCHDFLSRESAPGSDAGLCVAASYKVSSEIEVWGEDAKKIILTMPQAHALAYKCGVFLEGITGEKIGVIGALAAVGLRKAGNDGRVLWLPFLRDTNGIFTSLLLKERLNVDRIVTKNGSLIPDSDTIMADGWIRPVMQNKLITLIVEQTENHEQYKWQHVSKDYIKSISN